MSILRCEDCRKILKAVSERNASKAAKPATSCHLWFESVDEPEDVSSSWTLECSVEVEKSADCTYFCVVGWSPGGYSGIQQIEGGKRVAIFSMWNDGDDDVGCVQVGDGVRVSAFGGEGTGLKSMKAFDWKENERVTITVKGRKNASSSIWRVSCEVNVNGKKPFLMATFERNCSRNPPFRANGFYAFVEDWDRCDGARGHQVQRRAVFKDAKCNGKPMNKVRFTKVEDGDDAYANEKACAGKCANDTYFLSTGGREAESGSITSANTVLT